MNQEKTQVKGTAIVTGGARRIGACIVEALHQSGYDVLIHCFQSIVDAQALTQKLNEKRENSARLFVANLRDRHDAKALVQDMVAWKNRLDVLVNNASLFIKTPLSGFDERIWEALWQIHVTVPFALSQAAYVWLAKSENGNIVNITDVDASKPRRGYAVYTQTKAALKMQTEALALEYGPHVRVNAVAPGPILSPEGDNALPIHIQKEMLSKLPLGRMGAPKWVASAVLHVIANEFMTGETVRVDGGKAL